MALSIDIVDMYMGVLASLSNDAKLDLIGKLTASMRHSKTKVESVPEDVFSCFHTDWGGGDSPEEIAKKLRQSRNYNREIELW